MKLINKTLLYYLLIAAPLLIIAGVVSFLLIKKEVRDGTDEALWKEKINIESIIKLNPPLQPAYFSIDSLSFSKEVNERTTGFNYSDSSIYDKIEEEFLNYRVLRNYLTINTKNYLILVAKPTVEEDDLMESLLSSFGLIAGFLALAFILVNWLLSKVLWKPFYDTLDTLKQFDLSSYSPSGFGLSNTKEFKQLNDVLNKMTTKIHSDFIHQKEFTENAAHEMQTPLAVIKANTGLLMQSPRLKAEEMNQLQTIDNSVKKLTALNKALILLAKIENHQFAENSTVSIKNTVTKVLENFEEIIRAKEINVGLKMEQDCLLEMNPTLADILVTNLIQNAIRHNKPEGQIYVELKNNTLSVCNPGNPLTISNEDLFVRFKKNDASKDSLGLGLSIVKSIADVYGFTLSYSYYNRLHEFLVNFK